MVAPAVAFASSLTGRELQQLGGNRLWSTDKGQKCDAHTWQAQPPPWHPRWATAGRPLGLPKFICGSSLAAGGPHRRKRRVPCALPEGRPSRSKFLSAALMAQMVAARWHPSARWHPGSRRTGQGPPVLQSGQRGEWERRERRVQAMVGAKYSEDGGAERGGAARRGEVGGDGRSSSHPLIHADYAAISSSSEAAEEEKEASPTSSLPERQPGQGRKGAFAEAVSEGSPSPQAWQIDPEEHLANQKATDGPLASAVWGSAPSESATFGAKEPVYQVLEVNALGVVRKREVSRRQLLKSSGLRQRDVRRVDPSLWVTNSLPALLVRDNAILLNLGSLRAIATADSVLVFDHLSLGAQMFLDTLLERLRLDADASSSGAVTMPFELEVVESALISRTQRLENALFDVEPRVTTLLEQLPNKLTADALEELRLSKQALVELGAKAGALRQMLLELLEHSSDLRRMSAMSFGCRVVGRRDGDLVCETPGEKAQAEEEQEEVEMLLEYYLQRCDSCHGQAEKLLDSAKEMEDSISVNLSSRRLEVSRLELLLQVGTFAVALGALVAGIFGMNLRSRLEEHVAVFWLTTGGILLGSVLLFLAMFQYLRQRRIL